MEDFLDTAIDRNAPAVLSLPSAGMFRNFKTRFLRRCDGGFWIEGVQSEVPLIESLIRSAEPVGIAFKIGSRAVHFTAPFRELNRTCQLQPGGVTLMAVRVERPTAVKAVQRRSDFRVPVHADDPVRLVVWRIGDRAVLEDQPQHDPLQTVLRDLSVGGVGVTFIGAEGKPPKVCELDRLRLLIGCGSGKQFIVEGSCTPPRRVGETDQYTAGIKFKGLQSRLSGRQILSDLARIVNAIQLAERHRAVG